MRESILKTKSYCIELIKLLTATVKTTQPAAK